MLGVGERGNETDPAYSNPTAELWELRRRRLSSLGVGLSQDLSEEEMMYKL